MDKDADEKEDTDADAAAENEKETASQKQEAQQRGSEKRADETSHSDKPPPKKSRLSQPDKTQNRTLADKRSRQVGGCRSLRVFCEFGTIGRVFIMNYERDSESRNC